MFWFPGAVGTGLHGLRVALRCVALRCGGVNTASIVVVCE